MFIHIACQERHPSDNKEKRNARLKIKRLSKQSRVGRRTQIAPNRKMQHTRREAWRSVKRVSARAQACAAFAPRFFYRGTGGGAGRGRAPARVAPVGQDAAPVARDEHHDAVELLRLASEPVIAVQAACHLARQAGPFPRRGLPRLGPLGHAASREHLLESRQLLNRLHMATNHCTETPNR